MANAPRTESISDLRIENIVFAAPTSIAPIAMGRTMLYQTVNDANSGGALPMRVARSGSKNSSSGMMIHHAKIPPAIFTDASLGPMM